MASLPWFVFMVLYAALFCLGVLGFSLSGHSVLHMLFSLELILLGATLAILVASFELNSVGGSLWGLFAVGTAAAESAIGLGLIVSSFRLRGSLQVHLAG